MKIIKKLVFTLSLSLMASFSWAQMSKSPAAIANGKVGEANISIKYSSPSVRERKIWGELVPYDAVWRAGANAATTFETDKDIVVEGKTLAAGKYSIYAIPTTKEWTIIFNSQTGQWGTAAGNMSTLDATKDVLRVKVNPKKAAAFQERLVYTINDKGFVLSWENLDVPVAIK